VDGASCPVCSSSPALRIAPRQVELARALPPSEPLLSVQCQACMRRRRLTVYWLTAGELAGAHRNGNGSHP
jgi:hypothetical protein